MTDNTSREILLGPAGVGVDGDDSERISVSRSGSESDGDEHQQQQNEGSRKRKRPVNVTCEACKQRKVKCDRAQPKCGWCHRNNHACEYKERRKPGLRAGYGRELESRLDRLESVVAEQAKQLASHLGEVCPLPSIRSPAIAHHQPSFVVSKIDSRASTEADDMEAAALSHVIDPKLRSPTNVAKRQAANYLGGNDSAAASPSSRTWSQQPPSIDLSTSLHPAAKFQQPQPANSETLAPLPPYDLLYALVDLYFKHINVWLPLLDRKSTLNTLFGLAPLADGDRVLLHAIIATAIRFSRDPRLTAESRRQYHTSSKQKVQLFGIENLSVRSLQAMVIIAIDVTGTTNGPPGWNLLSMLSRSVVQIGLAAEVGSSLNTPLYPSIATLRAVVIPEPKSHVEDEERRRLFWSIFLLDRYATVATAFDFALDEKEIDRRLPCRDEFFSVDKPVETKWYRSGRLSTYGARLTDVHGYFSYHCELLGILGRIHQFLKRAIDIGSLVNVEQWQDSYRALNSELNTWHFNLPDDFANITRLSEAGVPSKATSCGWVMLHAAYCLTVIRLNSSAAYPAQTSPIFSSSYSAMQRCLSAVESLKQLGRFVKLSGALDKVGPPFAFAAWVSARVMLVHGSTMDHEVDPDIGFFVDLLAEMGQHWEVAQRYSEILNRVLEEYRNSQREDGAGGRVTPSAVKILADMRRCAFDLDYLISRQPPNGPRSHLPTRLNTPAPNELEWLDVFDIFNFPRLPLSGDHVDFQGHRQGQGPGVGEDQSMEFNGVGGEIGMPNFSVPDPESDWLFPSA